jgi:BON domain
MREAEKVQSEIQKVIADDPTIADAQHVIVTVEKGGLFKGEVIVLNGHVRSDSDKTKIASVAQLHAAGRAVRDSVTVTH